MSAWLRHLQRQRAFAQVPGGWFYAAARALITRILAAPSTEVLVACDPEQHSQLFGFACGEPGRGLLHWVYVKSIYRRARVATRLLARYDTQRRPLVVTSTTPDLALLLPVFELDPARLGEYVR